jgi:hypothetical protein
MDLGFLPENINYFAISGRAGFYGPKGAGQQVFPLASCRSFQHRHEDRDQLRTDPLTFDASKAIWGTKIRSLRRRLGCLSLLAEQVRPQSTRM